jgi:hypothetical protein
MAEITKTNPLASIMRQPKIYISLPSKGKYWAEGSLNPTVSGEFPVYSMTAKDEIILKTPDALMNGQGIVDVIQSCMPNVLNAWAAPQVDLDVILVAIRMATYGEIMTLEINHPTLEGPMDYEVNLREILDNLSNNTTWEERYEARPDLVLHLRPIDYRTQTITQIGEFETQRLMGIIRNEDYDEETKLRAFKDSFEKLSDKTLEIISKAVFKIESTGGTTDDAEFIDEFMRNCDAEVFDGVKNHISKLVESNSLKPLVINSTPEMLAKGAPQQIEVPFSFDNANFFG